MSLCAPSSMTDFHPDFIWMNPDFIQMNPDFIWMNPDLSGFHFSSRFRPCRAVATMPQIPQMRYAQSMDALTATKGDVTATHERGCPSSSFQTTPFVQMTRSFQVTPCFLLAFKYRQTYIQVTPSVQVTPSLQVTPSVQVMLSIQVTPSASFKMTPFFLVMPSFR